MRYLESQNDHGMMLQRALKIDESKARKRRLENTLQIQLESEAIRRRDVDLIFMAANPAQARLIRPQLKFHDAGDIPVYATGRVYSGQPDPARNRDLDGVRFPAMRWQLEHRERSTVPDVASLRAGSLASLFALGMDAWSLLPWLELMNKDPGFRFPGQSGNYFDERDGTLSRQPEWAIFANGRPAPLERPDLTDNGHR
jgi:outer membrane PBP1 activator LpoA protein